MLFRGNFVHTPHLGTLEILDDHLIGGISNLYLVFPSSYQTRSVGFHNSGGKSHSYQYIAVNEEGVISHFLPASSPTSLQLLEDSPAGQTLHTIPDGSFLLPTFCDLHLHAPQFLYQGTGLDLPLMQWLDNYALKSEARMDQNPALARRVYTRLALNLKEYGTGSVLLFGTIKEETKCDLILRSIFFFMTTFYISLILAECMQSAGIRGFIGKLSMDIDIRSPDSRTVTYVEPTASASLHAAKSFVGRCLGLVEHLPTSQRLIEPVLTPRFVPTCTNDLLRGLADLSERQNLKVQSHLAEAKDQVEWVRNERNMEDIDVFEKVN